MAGNTYNPYTRSSFIPPTDKDASSVRKKIHAAKKEMEAAVADEERNRKRQQFGDRYIECERLYRIILESYCNINGKKLNIDKANVYLKDVKNTIKAFGISIDEETIDKIFASYDKYVKRGTKSAKQLRNTQFHQLSETDIQESIDRFDELMTAMQKFIDAVMSR